MKRWKRRIKEAEIESHLALLQKNVQLIVVDQLQLLQAWQIRCGYSFPGCDSLIVFSSEDLRYGQCSEKKLELNKPLPEVI